MKKTLVASAALYSSPRAILVFIRSPSAALLPPTSTPARMSWIALPLSITSRMLLVPMTAMSVSLIGESDIRPTILRKNMSQFPEFSKVCLASSTAINDFTERYDPYSDFNFISMWSWDTEGTHKYSILHDNLVVTFSDYLTNEPFLSVLGSNQPDETVSTLLEYAENNNFPPELRLVPEIMASRLSSKFHVEEDPDNHDYVFATKDIAEYAGNKFKSKRQLKNKFEANYKGAEMKHESASSPAAQVKVFDLLHKWAKHKIAKEKDLDLKNEQSAILRSLKAADNDLRIFLTTLNHEGETIAFSIDELVGDEFAISHFFKTDHSHVGCTEYFNSILASHLHSTGVKFWNWEQDLGIKSLKDVKSRYRPTTFLKKYKVRLESNPTVQ